MTADFSVTQNAAKRIEFLITQEENRNVRMRVAVLGGGCSGFQYKFDFDAAKNEDDLIFSQGAVEVIVDTTSLELVKGSELDYVETLGSAAFVIKNPNATAKCGCGNSFAV
jgi:iron-sulfur cluster insertion protein